VANRLLAFVGAVALAAALSIPALAAPEPFALVTDRKSVDCTVEQQSVGYLGDPCPGPTVVNNPTDCPWDTDDYWSMYEPSGTIASGEVVTAQLCAIADGTIRSPVDATVRAKHPKLHVRMDSSDGRSWIAVPVRDGNVYAYTICADNFLRPPHPIVPDSNGGTGTLVTYTLTIDATERGANGVVALFKYGHGIWNISACN
jgi:hypothetical protein